MGAVSSKLIVVFKVLGELFFLYGLLAWSYGIMIQYTHPEWLPSGISHLLPWIRLDTFTILSFLLSALGFFIWRLIKELTTTAKHPNPN